MNFAYWTEHATARLRQRGIPVELLDVLATYGEERHAGHGARFIGFSRSSRQSLRREIGDKLYARWESRLNVYAVVSADEALITVGHRVHRRRERH